MRKMILLLAEMNNWNIFEISALILWVVSLGILGIAIILSAIFYKRSKTYYALGLILLSIGFMVGRIFRILVKFFLGEPEIHIPNRQALMVATMAFWTIIGLIFIASGYSLFNERIKGNLFIIFLISVLMVAILLSSFTVFYIETEIGQLPDIKAFTGTALVFENIALTATWLGFISLFYCVEKVSMDLFTVKKTKYFYTFLVFVALIITIIENYTGEATYILIMVYISCMAGMGNIFLYMASVSTGNIRRNALLVFLGH